MTAPAGTETEERPPNVNARSDPGTISDSVSRRATRPAPISSGAVPNVLAKTTRICSPPRLVCMTWRKVWLLNRGGACCSPGACPACGSACDARATVAVAHVVTRCSAPVCAAGGLTAGAAQPSAMNPTTPSERRRIITVHATQVASHVPTPNFGRGYSGVGEDTRAPDVGACDGRVTQPRTPRQRKGAQDVVCSPLICGPHRRPEDRRVETWLRVLGERTRAPVFFA